jgi:asparagine synthetase B (glutamine-hydrolysing)
VTAPDELAPGAWIVRVDTSRPTWTAEVLSSSTATDYVASTVGTTTVLLGGLLHNGTELHRLLDEGPEQNDASVIAHGYAQWGEAVIERVLGSCTTVICDGARRVVVAARDRLGTYPLFRAEPDSGLLFSNSIDALLGQRGVSNALNLPAFVDHLRHVWPFADETYFEAVRRVPPGNVLWRDANGVRLRRYWDPAPDGHVEWVRPKEIEQFDGLFEQAVARCLVPGDVGVFLSGGLDSVSVAAVATNKLRATGGRDPLALSIAFPGHEANEEAVQRGVAASLGVEQVMFDWETAVGQRGLIRDVIDLSARAPAPLLNLWMPAYDRLAEAGRDRGCVTILGGGGGDEWLMVSPFYAADLIRNFDLAALARLYNEHRRSHNVRTFRYLQDIVWRFGLRPLALDATVTTLHRRAPSALKRLALRRLKDNVPHWLAPDPALHQEMVCRELRRRDEQWTAAKPMDGAGRRYPRIYFAEVRSGLEHPLVSMEFEELYWQGRRLGMQILQPFWDPELVAFLYRTPPELLNAGGRSKALVRGAVARRFPGLGFEHQRKIAATGVARSLVDDEGRRAWSKLDEAGSLAVGGLVDGPALRARVDEILGKREMRKYYLVWDLLAVESFLKARHEG